MEYQFSISLMPIPAADYLSPFGYPLFGFSLPDPHKQGGSFLIGSSKPVRPVVPANTAQRDAKRVLFCE